MLRCGDFDADEAYILPKPCEGETLFERALKFRAQLRQEFRDLEKRDPDLAAQINVALEPQPHLIDIVVWRGNVLWDRYRIF